MLEVENVTPKDLQEVTGKSKSVVYDWLDCSNSTHFPSNEALIKILCRLGLSLDEFIRCESDKLPKDNLYRTYKEYIMGSINNKWLSTSLLDNNNYEEILNCFINDVIRVEEMLDY